MLDVLRSTEKLYYLDQYLKSTSASIVRLHPEAIELDRTVAFPEGGGQEADMGWLDTPVGCIRFVWAKRLYGTPLNIEGFKGGKSGGIILHMVHVDDLPLLDALAEGMPVTVTIDVQRRERLTVAHSASHFLYAAVLKQRPDLEKWTIGCHIKEDAARFDFIVEDIFTPEDVAAIEAEANRLIDRGLAIENEEVAGYYDARIWKYGSLAIPCGGTHLPDPQAIGPLQVRRKKLGKNKERLTCEFVAARIDTSRYREQVDA